MPVHGEPRHLKANAELALATGVPAERIMLTLDGGVIDLVDGRATVVGAVPCGYVYVDGASVGDLTESSLKDRRVLGAEGFITCFVVVDSVDGKVTAGPEIQARGFVEDDSAFDAVHPEDQGRPSRTPCATATPTSTPCSSSCAASSAAGSTTSTAAAR